jgi:cephalosporin hydroxylase
MGVPCLKTPLDLWIYQEILFETRPSLVVETGSHARAGSALFLAHVLDAIGAGDLVSIDVLADPGRPTHPRIRWVAGSSSDPRVVDPIFAGRDPAERRLVVLDSDHSKAHVLAELSLLAPRVARGGYLIVEDTNVNGHPVCGARPGPVGGRGGVPRGASGVGEGRLAGEVPNDVQTREGTCGERAEGGVESCEFRVSSSSFRVGGFQLETRN